MANTAYLHPQGPATAAFKITPHNTTNLPKPIRVLTVGELGAVSYVGLDGVTYTTNPLPPGTYPMSAVRVRTTGTTAKQLTGWV